MTVVLEKALIEHYSLLTKALANPNRFEILDRLAQRPYCVEELAEACGLSIANTSQHLQTLKRAYLVIKRTAGNRIVYQLANPSICEVLTSVRRYCLSYFTELRELKRTQLDPLDSGKPMSIAKLLKKMDKKTCLLVDARPLDEYQAGHIEQAISIYEQARYEQARVDNSTLREMVVYGRSNLCPLAFEAVSKFTAQGFKARRLDGGFAEWSHYHGSTSKDDGDRQGVSRLV